MLDAPSRGHDLKLDINTRRDVCGRGCPLTGARLETNKILLVDPHRKDAPSRGHDLKLPVGSNTLYPAGDAPSRGHDLKLIR